MAAIGIAGAAGGGYARPSADPALASTAVFNLAPLERGAGECMALKFDAGTPVTMSFLRVTTAHDGTPMAAGS